MECSKSFGFIHEMHCSPREKHQDLYSSLIKFRVIQHLLPKELQSLYFYKNLTEGMQMAILCKKEPSQYKRLDFIQRKYRIGMSQKVRTTLKYASQ